MIALQKLHQRNALKLISLDSDKLLNYIHLYQSINNNR